MNRRSFLKAALAASLAPALASRAAPEFLIQRIGPGDFMITFLSVKPKGIAFKVWAVGGGGGGGSNHAELRIKT